jgi:hypothetical protein
MRSRQERFDARKAATAQAAQIHDDELKALKKRHEGKGHAPAKLSRRDLALTAQMAPTTIRVGPLRRLLGK